jgi:hypothetical protein
MKTTNFIYFLVSAVNFIVPSLALPFNDLYNPESIVLPPGTRTLRRSFLSAYQDHMDAADPIAVLGETENEALAAGVCCKVD